MSTGRHPRMRPASARLLRWYPLPWRARYGAELEAFLEDSLGESRPTWRLRASIARAGLRERLHAAGLLGDAHAPDGRLRQGSLVVLASWAVAAGAALLTASRAGSGFPWLPGGRSGDAHRAALAVVGLVGLGLALVVLAGLVALPATARLLRNRGEEAAGVGRQLARCAVGALAACLVGGILGPWAWPLRAAARHRSGLAGAVVLLVVVAVLVAAAIQGIAAAAVITRRLQLSPGAVRAETFLSLAIAAATLALAAGLAGWWLLQAGPGPRVLQAGGPTAIVQAGTPAAAAALVLVAAATAAAVLGVLRLVRGALAA